MVQFDAVLLQQINSLAVTSVLYSAVSSLSILHAFPRLTSAALRRLFGFCLFLLAFHPPSALRHMFASRRALAIDIAFRFL